MSKVFILRNDSKLDGVKRGLYAFLKGLNLEKAKQVTITDYKEDKTGEQRSSFHLLCRLLGNEVGHAEDEVKEIVKKAALGTKTITMAGITAEVTRPSEGAKRDEYSHLIETVYRLASEMGIQLPGLRR
jgi:hypothetical protein